MSEEIKLPVDRQPEVTKAALAKRASRARQKAQAEFQEGMHQGLQETAAPITMVPTFIDPEAIRKQELKAKIARDRAHKAELVTGKFLFNECPGGELKFAFREFPGDPLVTYTLKHDQIYTIPLGVAQHLNDRCSYPEYFHNQDGGKSVEATAMYITTQVHRTSFIPLNFSSVDVGYMNKPIAQVTYANPMPSPKLLDSMGR